MINNQKYKKRNSLFDFNVPMLNNMNLSILQDRTALSNLVNKAKKLKEHQLQKENQNESKKEENQYINYSPKSNYIRVIRPTNSSRTTKIFEQNKIEIIDKIKTENINNKENIQNEIETSPIKLREKELENNENNNDENNNDERLQYKIYEIPKTYSPEIIRNSYRKQRLTGSIDLGINQIQYLNNNIGLNLIQNYNGINNYYHNENIEKIHMNSFYTIKQNSTVKEFSYLEDQNIAKEETMEDKGKSIENFNNDKSNILFLLFDGHGGDTISKYLQKNFDKIYKKTLKENNNNIEKSLKISFSKINSEIKKLNLNSIGSTGCIVHIKWLSESNLIIYIANCGDTRASLISPINYLRLSKDHRTDNKEEQERIINCGGNIINNRVMGMLMLTRAFGDFELEKNGVYCEPFINKVQVDLNQKNQFVIMATDGIWDLNNEREIMEMIMFDNNSTSLVQNIVKNTLRKDAWDNLSIFDIKLT